MAATGLHGRMSEVYTFTCTSTWMYMYMTVFFDKIQC